jgi:hypothetical protein
MHVIVSTGPTWHITVFDGRASGRVRSRASDCLAPESSTLHHLTTCKLLTTCSRQTFTMQFVDDADRSFRGALQLVTPSGSLKGRNACALHADDTGD